VHERPTARRRGFDFSSFSRALQVVRDSLWGLLDTHYDRVKGVWEERFERRYGFWRGLADQVVLSGSGELSALQEWAVQYEFLP
jgi:hypothetical protein